MPFPRAVRPRFRAVSSPAIFVVGLVAIGIVAIGTVATATSGTVGASSAVEQSDAATVYVSVTDLNGAAIPGLGPSDFRLRVDDRPRHVLVAEPAREPLAIAVVTDGVTRDVALTTRQTLHHLVDVAAREVPATRIGLSVDEVARAPDFVEVGTGRRALDQAIDLVYRTPAGADLEESLIVAADALARAPTPRRALLVISYRRQLAGTFDVRRAAEALRRANAMVWICEIYDERPGFTISPTGGAVPAPELPERLMALNTIAGGAYGRLSGDRGLAGNTPRLVRQILTQYAITYARSAGDSALRIGVVRPEGARPLRVFAPSWAR